VTVEVEVEGLEVYAYHGVLPHERAIGQTFLLDLVLTPQSDAATLSDRLEDAVDYSAVCARAIELAQGGPYQLIERLAGVLADALLSEFPLDAVRVRVRKPHAPLQHRFGHVAAVVERRRPGAP
jgi:dihydroneopterin aldolase